MNSLSLFLTLALLIANKPINGQQSPTYHFKYVIDHDASAVHHGHWETKTGDYVSGAYSVLDPDGRLRTVYYEVDGQNGFRAYVKSKRSALLYNNHLTHLDPTRSRSFSQYQSPIVFHPLVSRIT